MPDPFPNWAYVPGQTPRHPDGAFDVYKADAGAGLSSETARLAVLWLKAGFAWEAHELLEAVWIALSDGSEEKNFAQAVIQLANAELKVGMDRPKAVARLCQQVEALTMGIGAEIALPGLTQQDVMSRLRLLTEG